VVFNSNNNNIYVANALSDDIFVIETRISQPIVDTISDQSISIGNLVPSDGNKI